MISGIKSVQKEEALSFGAGFLLMRALPASAVLAGWRLSASLGTQFGEIMSAVIFALGCAVVLVANQTGEKCICITVRMCAAVILALSSSGGSCGIIPVLLSAADTALCTAALTGRWLKRGTAAMFCVLSAAIAAIICCAPNFPSTEMLLPLAAALSVGAAADDISCAQKISAAHLVVGMTAAMMVDMLK